MSRIHEIVAYLDEVLYEVELEGGGGDPAALLEVIRRTRGLLDTTGFDDEARVNGVREARQHIELALERLKEV